MLAATHTMIHTITHTHIHTHTIILSHRHTIILTHTHTYIHPPHPQINELMPRLAHLLPRYPCLARGVTAVHYLCSLFGDMLVTLLYDKDLGCVEGEWKEQVMPGVGVRVGLS